MGLFDKIKNILFEDDEEEVEIPVYSKEEVNTKENKKEEKKKVVDEKVELEPIQTEETSRFKNIKRDFDFSFDEEEQLDEIVSAPVVESTEVKVEEPVQEEVVEPKRSEKRDVFLSFDEEEFERLNSRINHNEEKARRETRRDVVKDEEDPMLIARRANSNFSSTTPTVNAKDYSRDTDRYKIHSGRDVKKPFTPSPVISPVYGILDKNYTKDSIVDKKDGMKRERIKPIKTEVVLESEIEKQEELRRIEEENTKKDKKVNIDLVRKKAYGALEEMSKSEDEEILTKKNKVVLTTVGEQEDLVEFQEKFGDDIVDDAMLAVANYNTNKVVETKEKNINIEDKVEEDLNKTKVQEYDNSVKEVKKSSDDNKSKLLDDLEKTSTLQILDDIEKELSSIKPISKSYQVDEEEYQPKEDDTLETDLFNLIDSMYEQGEEDEDE